jgi:hypothetical protein
MFSCPAVPHPGDLVATERLAATNRTPTKNASAALTMSACMMTSLQCAGRRLVNLVNLRTLGSSPLTTELRGVILVRSDYVGVIRDTIEVYFS